MNELPANLFEQQFLRLIQARTGSLSPDCRRLLNQALRDAINQHSCVDLSGEPVEIIDELRELDAVGEPGESRPFVLSGSRLYLARFYEYEQRVAEALIERNMTVPLATDPALLIERLNELFPPGNTDEPDYQKLAAWLAVTRRLAIITGGPGTGKTTTVARILDLLTGENPDLGIRLAAPTGKASMRLAAALSSWAAENKIQVQVQTLHRLLGMRRDLRSYRHNADNPVRADVIIVDEASMIDLVMMHRLLSALQDGARLILLGDPNQLPSVDTGNVLADICSGEPGYSDALADEVAPFIGNIPRTNRSNGLTDAVCQLQKTWRFAPDSSIAAFSKAIQAGQLPATPTDTTVVMQPPHEEDARQLLAYYSDYLAIMNSEDAAAQLEVFEQVRILCSRRGGAGGVETINSQIESVLESMGRKSRGDAFYHGRPVMITRNDYNLGLYNGDIGICHRLDSSGQVRPGQVRPGQVRPGQASPEKDGPQQYQVIFESGERYLASRLPEHESCFAMTIHKSQGSEFDHVILLLAEEENSQASEMITRELLYTAVTRTRHRLTVHASRETLRDGVSRSAARVSGMSGFIQSRLSS